MRKSPPGALERLLEGVHVDPGVEVGVELERVTAGEDRRPAAREQAAQVVERLAEVAARALLVLARPEHRGQVVARERLAAVAGQVREQAADLLRLEAVDGGAAVAHAQRAEAVDAQRSAARSPSAAGSRS